MLKLLTTAGVARSVSRRTDSSAANSILKINVGGKRYMLLRSCLTDYPDTMLGRLANMPTENLVKYDLWDSYIQEEQEIFFNRPSALFTPVAQFYQTGHVHNVPGVCPAAMREELQFWGIYPKYVTTFCRMCLKKKSSTALNKDDKLFNNSIDESLTNTDIDSAIGFNTARRSDMSANLPTEPNGSLPMHQMNQKKQSLANGGARTKNPSEQLQDRMDDFGPEEDETIRQQIWGLLEGSTSNRISLVLNFVSIVFILLNIVLIILDSLHHYHWSDFANREVFNITQHHAIPKGGTGNQTEEAYEEQFHDKTVEESHLSRDAALFLYSLDWMCTLVFSIEFVVKLWASPNRCLFLRQPMTIVDVLAIFPAYVETIANMLQVHHGGSLSVLQILRIFRAFRVFRIMKLAKYESSFKVLGNCLKDCIPEFVLLFVYLFMATLLFGTMLYYAEGEVEGTFYGSIPEAIWWAIVTYFSFADAPPTTLFGKFVAAAASICGVVLMALPVSVIVDKFSTFINDFRRQKELTRAASLENFINRKDLEPNGNSAVQQSTAAVAAVM